MDNEYIDKMNSEDYKKYKEEMEVFLDSSYQVHKEILDKKLEEKDIVINSLLDRLYNKELELLGKSEIMQIFTCESDKALRILKLMYANNFGCKVGKEYYITKNEFKKFMEAYKGKDLKI